MNADKPVITRFLTASRRDLFTLTADLLTMVDEKVYQDAARPLVLGVGGTMSCGKKIITDAAVNHLFDRPSFYCDEESPVKPPAMIGVQDHDEYWFGTRQGRTFEIDYIDAAWPNRRAYSRRLMYGSNDMDEKLSDFMALRHYGGLTVVQNPGLSFKPGINIYIERNIPGCTIGYEEARTLSAPLYLTRHFNKLARHNEWARYVEIEIQDGRR